MSEPQFSGPLAGLFRQLIAHSPPDPWSAEIDAAVKARDAIPLCQDCLHPQAPHQWFCPHCNFPTGDYVPMMPYLQVFWIGEILRRGVTGPGQNTDTQNVGFALFGLGQYSLFAPIYWFWLVSKSLGKPICQARRVPLECDPPSAEAGPDPGR
jgi:hypothetical protein